MLSRFFLLAFVVGLAAPASAQKLRPVSPLELGTDPVAEIASDGLTALRASRPALQTGLDVPAVGATPEAQARGFLARRGGAQKADASDFVLERVRRGVAVTSVRFRQTVGGVPVWGPETVVSIDRAGRVQALADGSRGDLAAVDLVPALDAAQARAAVHAHVGLVGTADTDEVELMVWPGTPTRLVWVVRAAGGGASGDWEGVVDAHSGALVRVADRSASLHDDDDRPAPTALPLADLSPQFRSLDGTGFIFDPNPLTRAGVPYGTPGYTDGAASVSATFCASPANYDAPECDADSPELRAARTAVTLRDITFDGAEYSLVGPWAEIRELQAPARGLFAQPSADFDVTRGDDAFEAVNAYWHIDNYMRYVNTELGVDARPRSYTGGVRFDPHAIDGEDNSRYLSASETLLFGEGCVDDAEDADVIIHELGHGLHDWLSAISNQPGDGLSEGFGDYVATSYTRSLNLLRPADDAYNWVFKWDGHNPCWQGRVTDAAGPYVAGSSSGLHGPGQNWSTANLRVWDAIGREKTDTAVFEGIAMTNSATRQPDAAQAVLQAALALGYDQSDLDVFYDSYVAQGYNVMPVGMPDTTSTVPSMLLSAPSPNPFNGESTFDVRVEDTQTVSVEVFDAVGRRVAVLFDGEMTEGQRVPLSLSAAGLASGVYVVRVTGESVGATRRVTVIR